MSEWHVMIDLETMSTRTDAAIVAIGAYAFDPNGDDREHRDPLRTYHQAVTLASSIEAGLHVDGDTVGWWMQQSEAARAELLRNPIWLSAALIDFRLFLLADGARRALSSQDVVIWSHAGFDFPILDHAYDVTRTAKPYWYRSPRDLRTIIHAAYGRNLDVDVEEPDFPKNPAEHDAGWDAWHQAVMVQYCFRKLSMKVFA